MKISAILLVAFFFNTSAFALTFYQNNKDYVVRCTGDDGSSWSVDQRAMVNSAHGLKLCADNKPSISIVGGPVRIGPVTRPRFSDMRNNNAVPVKKGSFE